MMPCSFSVTTSNDWFNLPSSYCLVKHVIQSTNSSASEIDFIAKNWSMVTSSSSLSISFRCSWSFGYGLEAPCKYPISGKKKAVDWMQRKATTFLQEHSLPVNKCLGKKYKSEKLFMCPLYGGRLWFKCSCRKVSALWSVCFRVSALERFSYKGIP